MQKSGRWVERWQLPRTVVTVLVGLSMTLTGLVAAQPATADTLPAAGIPATTSALTLPNWQVDGVVWAQAIVGNTVYAVGDFANVRPPGVAVGGTGSRAAANFFAFDITTGEPVGIWHSLNGSALAVTTSPDKKTLYVVGNFTRVDGQSRAHLAAFDATTGALLGDLGGTDGQVRAVTATADTVYLGGSFTTVSANGASAARTNLAAVRANAGGFTSWAPSADSVVRAMVAVGGRVVVGGQFVTINGSTVNGVTALDPTTGAVGTWKMNTTIKNAAANAGVASLITDGTYVYATNFNVGGGAFEGPWAAKVSDGTLYWATDCLGDTNDSTLLAGVLYTVGHAHNCSTAGSFPDATNRWQRAVAMTPTPSGVNTGPDAQGHNYSGIPKSGILHWWPQVPSGDYTGQAQGGWTIESAGDYVVMGGEFPKVSGSSMQQGLARFKLGAATAPPQFQTTPTRTVTAPVATVLPNKSIRVDFQSAWDIDNQNLTYQVYRNYGTEQQALVKTFTLSTNFWTLPDQEINDLPDYLGPHNYTIRVSDGTGNVVSSAVSNTVTGGVDLGAYPTAVIADGAASYWRLDEPVGTAVYDLPGSRDGVTFGTVQRFTPGAIAGDSDPATTFISGGATLDNGAAITSPSTYSYELWFKTGATKGGKLFGFSTARTGSGTSDRTLSMDAGGKLRLSVGTRTLLSAASYNNNAWHQAVVTTSPAGSQLYVDGARIAVDTAATTPAGLTGYWRINGDVSGSWFATNPTKNYINAAVDEVSVYPVVLTNAQIAAHYSAAKG